LLDEDFVLLLIGNDWSVKGLETVLRTVSLLSALPLHVLIAGNDSVEAFQRLARELGISGRCHFESPRLDVLDFYAAADLYVSPSLEDSFGLPVAEAMACGLPAISSLFAGVSELIESGVDGFLLRDPRDPKELASLLEELFHNQEQRERIGQAAAQKALGWTWDRNASETWEFLRQALVRKSRQRSK
jgi:UDP-glucose:(heptosyl)LPS alpha-1,3-glucosyltransferase